MQRMRILAYCLISNHWHITGQDGGACSKTGSGRVPAATPFDKLTTCAGVDAEACATGPMASSPGRPDGWRWSMPWRPRKNLSGCGRASGAAGHSPDHAWVRRTARRLGLESTLRDPWRPKKPSPAVKGMPRVILYHLRFKDPLEDAIRCTSWTASSRGRGWPST
jgi:hypothetical protein